MTNPFGFADTGKTFEEGAAYDNFAAGDYVVTGIHSWVDLDDADLPPFVPSKMDDRLVARFRFTVNGEQGPPMSMAAGDMVLLARAFGCPLANYPEVDE